jgi:hypothetical protein
MEAEMTAARERRDVGARPTGWTEKEQVIVTAVTAAFAGAMLDAKPVDVRTPEGGTAAALRFTLNEIYSTDLNRGRIESGTESVEELSNSVITELRRQAGG